MGMPVRMVALVRMVVVASMIMVVSMTMRPVDAVVRHGAAPSAAVSSTCI